MIGTGKDFSFNPLARAVLPLMGALAIVFASGSGWSQAGAASTDSGDQYVNTAQSPWMTTVQAAKNSPDQKRFLDSSFPGGMVQHGKDGEVSDKQCAYGTCGSRWPAVAPPSCGKTDPRSAAAIKAVNEATGADNPCIGTNLVSGNLAATAMAVGMQQAIARAQMPESIMPLAKEMQNQQNQTSADNCANMERNQSACALEFVRTYLENFTSNGGNKWNRLRDQLFVPIAILLLLPGAVIAQVKAIVAQGFSVFGNVHPFDGIIRAIVAIFLIPATSLVVNYGIDLSNSINHSISDSYTRIFGTDMYRDAMAAHIRAFPVRQPSENKNCVPNQMPNMDSPLGQATSAFAKMEGRGLSIKLEDPVAGLNMVPPDRANEMVPYSVNAQRLAYNGANAALATTWSILCAFQTVYLYYLWFVGPVVAALWVWPSKQLRDALPNWIDGCVTLCFWSLFWNTTILLMACFRGVDDTGTVIMTALNFLSTACVKFAFDFSGLVKAAGAEAGKMAEKAMQGGGKGGGGGKGAGKGASGNQGSQGSHAFPGSGTGTGGGGGGSPTDSTPAPAYASATNSNSFESSTDLRADDGSRNGAADGTSLASADAGAGNGRGFNAVNPEMEQPPMTSVGDSRPDFASLDSQTNVLASKEREEIAFKNAAEEAAGRERSASEFADLNAAVNAFGGDAGYAQVSFAPPAADTGADSTPGDRRALDSAGMLFADAGAGAGAGSGFAAAGAGALADWSYPGAAAEKLPGSVDLPSAAAGLAGLPGGALAAGAPGDLPAGTLALGAAPDADRDLRGHADRGAVDPQTYLRTASSDMSTFAPASFSPSSASVDPGLPPNSQSPASASWVVAQALTGDDIHRLNGLGMPSSQVRELAAHGFTAQDMEVMVTQGFNVQALQTGLARVSPADGGGADDAARWAPVREYARASSDHASSYDSGSAMAAAAWSSAVVYDADAQAAAAHKYVYEVQQFMGELSSVAAASSSAAGRERPMSALSRALGQAGSSALI